MGQRDWSSVVAPMPTTPAATRPAESRTQGLVYQRVYEFRAYPDEPPMQKYRDSDDPEDEEKERPALWWTPRSVGFRAKILVNPLGGEVRYETQAYIAYLRGGSEEDHLKAIADRVVAWEYILIDDEGNRHEVPPPASDPENGWQRFLDLPNDVLIWLKDEVRTAHFPKLATRSGKPSSNPRGTSEPDTPTTIESEEVPPPS